MMKGSGALQLIFFVIVGCIGLTNGADYFVRLVDQSETLKRRFAFHWLPSHCTDHRGRAISLCRCGYNQSNICG